jgi:protein-tyrosine-phosphatase
MSLFIIGIVCSGNTCRSPIAKAWLRQMLDKEQTEVDIWTAGLNAKTGARVSDKVVGPEEPVRGSSH